MRMSVVLDCLDPDGLVPFWCAALGYTLVAEPTEAYRVLAPTQGQPAGPVLILQRVPEPAVGKNRMHLDVHPEDPEQHIAVLEEMGGRRLGARVDELGIWWQQMLDPEGHVLCVVAHAQAPPE